MLKTTHFGAVGLPGLSFRLASNPPQKHKDGGFLDISTKIGQTKVKLMVKTIQAITNTK